MSSPKAIDEKKSEQVWHSYMTHGKVPEDVYMPWYESKFFRPIARLLPASPRCSVCYYPFDGIGGKLMKALVGLQPSPLNPHMCNICERFAETFQGGAEVEMSLLFADVRGSTTLAESMSPAEYSKLINRFYLATTRVLFNANAMVEKLIGDAVNGFFVPGFAGEKHSQVALEAAKAILKATGHGDPGGPWIEVGVGVHTGVAYVGSVLAEGGGATISVLGDDVNAAARLGSLAGPGEVIASDALIQAAGVDTTSYQSRRLELKGRSGAMDAWVIQV